MTKKEKLKYKLVKLLNSYRKSDVDLNCSIDDLKLNSAVYIALKENDMYTFNDILKADVEKIVVILKKISLLNNLYYSCRTFIKNNSPESLNYVNGSTDLIVKLSKIDEYKLNSKIDFNRIQNTRLCNALKAANIYTYFELCQFGDYHKIKNLGAKSINDLELHILDYIDDKIQECKEVKSQITDPIEDEFVKEMNKFAANLYNSLLNKNETIDIEKFNIVRSIVLNTMMEDLANYLSKDDFKLITLKYIDKLSTKEITEMFCCSRQNISQKLQKLNNSIKIKYTRKISNNVFFLNLLKCLNYFKNEILYGYLCLSLNKQNIDTEIITKLLENLNVNIALFTYNDDNLKEEKEEVIHIDSMSIEMTIVYKSLKNIIESKISYVTLISLYNFLQGNIKDNSRLQNIDGFGMCKNIDKNQLLLILIQLYNLNKIKIKVSKHGRLYCVLN